MASHEPQAVVMTIADMENVASARMPQMVRGKQFVTAPSIGCYLRIEIDYFNGGAMDEITYEVIRIACTRPLHKIDRLQAP